MSNHRELVAELSAWEPAPEPVWVAKLRRLAEWNRADEARFRAEGSPWATSEADWFADRASRLEEQVAEAYPYN